MYRNRNRKQEGNDREKRRVLRRFWKTVSVGAEVTSGGRLFQRRLPATGNARSVPQLVLWSFRGEGEKRQRGNGKGRKGWMKTLPSSPTKNKFLVTALQTRCLFLIRYCSLTYCIYVSAVIERSSEGPGQLTTECWRRVGSTRWQLVSGQRPRFYQSTNRARLTRCHPAHCPTNSRSADCCAALGFSRPMVKSTEAESSRPVRSDVSAVRLFCSQGCR